MKRFPSYGPDPTLRNFGIQEWKVRRKRSIRWDKVLVSLVTVAVLVGMWRGR